jgi:nucleoside-diphosphate-sugar epimerase
MAATNLLRTTGTRNLLELARQAGARRFITQSIVFGYGYADHGTVPLTESSAFGAAKEGPTAPHVEAMAVNEQLVRSDPEIEGIALRYGLFYGGDADSMGAMLRARKVPVPAKGGGSLPWIHLDDAVTATLAALERGRPGAAYNVVDDQPATWREMMSAAAARYGAPPPRALPGWLIRLAAPYVASMVLDTSMHVSHELAREELGWAPDHRTFTEWGSRRVAT